MSENINVVPLFRAARPLSCGLDRLRAFQQGLSEAGYFDGLKRKNRTIG